MKVHKMKDDADETGVLAVLLLIVVVGLFTVVACSVSGGNKNKKTGQTDEVSENSASQNTSSSNQAVNKTGAELWSENCQRCHNMRSPNEFSDGEWEVISHHMRVRANLTADEHRKILEFLKKSN